MSFSPRRYALALSFVALLCSPAHGDKRTPLRYAVPWPQQIVTGGNVGGGYSFAQFPSLGQNTHVGLDIGGGCGLDVKAVASGVVVDSISLGHDLFSFLGNAVRIRHAPEGGRPVYTLYLHLMDPPLVLKGASVSEGDIIGKTGNTGAAYGCHLHFEVRHFDDLLHPEFLINGRRNIYGSGDWRSKRQLYLSWSDPEVWFSGKWSGPISPGLTIEAGAKIGGFSHATDGRLTYDGLEIFDAWIASNAIDFRSVVLPSPSGLFAVVFYLHEDFGAQRIAFLDFLNKRVSRFDTTAQRLGPTSVYWADTRGIAAIPILTDIHRTGILFVDGFSGKFYLYKAPPQTGGDGVDVDMSSLRFDTGGAIKFELKYFRLDKEGYPIGDGRAQTGQVLIANIVTRQ